MEQRKGMMLRLLSQKRGIDFALMTKSIGITQQAYRELSDSFVFMTSSTKGIALSVKR